MKLIASNEFMIQSLSSLLNDEETLQTPFYATIEKIGKQRHNWFCFFGTTESALLIAILNTIDASKIDWTTRVPLDIKKVKIKKSLIPYQIIIRIKFNEGNGIRIRASKKLLMGNFSNQDQNLNDFIKRLASYTT